MGVAVFQQNFTQNRGQVRFGSGLVFNDPYLDPCISGHPFTSYLQALNHRYMLNINRYAIRFWKPITSVCLVLFLIYSEILLSLLSPDHISPPLGNFSNTFPYPLSIYMAFTSSYSYCFLKIFHMV